MLPHRPRGAIAELFRLYLPSVRARCLPIRQDAWATHGARQALRCLLELSQMQKAAAIERTEVRVGGNEMEAAASGDVDTVSRLLAPEFALVRARGPRLEELAAEGQRGARRAVHQVDDVTNYLSSCQFGITLASLGIGFLGEPAIAGLLEPLFGDAISHGLAVAISVERPIESSMASTPASSSAVAICWTASSPYWCRMACMPSRSVTSWM